MKLYQKLATLVAARLNCIKAGNEEWAVKHEDSIKDLAKTHLPRSAGFDAGSSVRFGESTGERLVIDTAYVNANRKWTFHRITITPTLRGDFNIVTTGRNPDVREYILDTFDLALNQEHSE